MSTAICYNLIYNSSTSAFEKHGVDDVINAGYINGNISEGISALCSTYNHNLIIELDGVSVIEDLNLSADTSVISSNNSLASAITSANQSTSGTPNVSATNINEVNSMRIQLTIIAISPVIKTKYLPTEATKPHEVVTR